MFPIEWLVIENIRNIKSVRVDGETKKMLKDYYKKILKDERQAREEIESKVRDNPANHNKVQFLLMANREEVPEDEHQCFYCTDFAYVSMIKCKNHKIHYCLYH